MLEAVKATGGQLWTPDGNRIHVRLPASLAPLMDELRANKLQLLAELARRRPAMPRGVRLVLWNPKPAPVKLSPCSTVTDTEKFIRSTLKQLEAQLNGKGWQSGGWGLLGLLARLEACGCRVALDNPREALQ
jgi:hypothetical protein